MRTMWIRRVWLVLALVSAAPAEGQESQSADAAATLTRLLNERKLEAVAARWSDSLSTLGWIALSILVTVVVIVRVRQAFAAGNVLAAYTIASIGGYLVSPISWGHHLLFLAPAVALLVGDGRSPIRWAAAIPAIYLVIDRYGGGEDNRLSAYRILFMVMVVTLLPLDRRRTDRHVTAAMPTPFRWRTAAER